MTATSTTRRGSTSTGGSASRPGVGTTPPGARPEAPSLVCGDARTADADRRRNARRGVAGPAAAGHRDPPSRGLPRHRLGAWARAPDGGGLRARRAALRDRGRRQGRGLREGEHEAGGVRGRAPDAAGARLEGADIVRLGAGAHGGVRPARRAPRRRAQPAVRAPPAGRDRGREGRAPVFRQRLDLRRLHREEPAQRGDPLDPAEREEPARRRPRAAQPVRPRRRPADGEALLLGQRPGRARQERARRDGGRRQAGRELRLAALLAELGAEAPLRLVRRRDRADRLPRAALVGGRDRVLERLALRRRMGRVPLERARPPRRPLHALPAGKGRPGDDVRDRPPAPARPHARARRQPPARRLAAGHDLPDQSLGGRRSRFVSDRARFDSSRRFRDAAVGAVGRRARRTFSASRSASTSRSVASCRLRHWLRSSCAIARRPGPARATTRRFCASDSAVEASTSKTASTRLSDRCACCPPGPLDREKRSSISDLGNTTERVTRIDSLSMAPILLDVEGVLHVSGRPIEGAARAVSRLREGGHRLRFITNSTTRSRAGMCEELRAAGVELDDSELQTTAQAAVHALRGKRVFALTMAAVVQDLEEIDLVGDTPDAVLLGGADETDETNRVFSYMNLSRAFAELDAGADLYCLHRNRWRQTAPGPLLETGSPVAGLEYAAGIEATVLGKPSPAYFAAALEELDADADMAWMVGDDLESDIAGGRAHGLRTVLVKTGKFRQRDLDQSAIEPDVLLDSIADLPYWLEEDNE